MQNPPFTLYWHRAGNKPSGIEAVVRAARTPRTVAGRPLRHGVECDLKWAEHDGAPLLYLHHGLTGLRRLPTDDVLLRVARGEVSRLDASLALPGAAGLLWMVEVKRGHGPQQEALRACVELFRSQSAVDRLLFASSALPVLADLRAAHPGVGTGLFVGWTFRDGRALQVPKLGVRRALRQGVLLDAAALVDVDLLIPTHPLTAGRASPKPQAPLARRWKDVERFAAAGLAGAFAYFDPAASPGRNVAPAGAFEGEQGSTAQPDEACT